ncbi:LysR family transcriptional regulator [Pseudomonas sp. Y24-6]|uniref:LysR family transcriptional regulator n=1 Tax=Pseudomonas sp. Y24-6 TaxID=2750013 RepID=UPI00399B4243
MRYRRLDLNLLVALDALLSECSVSRAAERLCLGQSAASSALGRLREHFNDPLLVQVGRRLEPTALGLELLPKVREALALTRDIVDSPVGFDPATCTRRNGNCSMWLRIAAKPRTWRPANPRRCSV